jgi:hypothetical protein
MALEALVWVVVGVALAGVRAVPLMWRGINTRAFAEVIVRLLEEDKPRRALKLCGVVPNAPSARVVRVTLEAALATRSHGRASTIRDELARAFDVQRDEELALVRKHRWLGPLGMILAGYGAALVVTSETTPTGQAWIAALSVVLALAAHRKVRSLELSSAEMREAIVSAATALVLRHGGRLAHLED